MWEKHDGDNIIVAEKLYYKILLRDRIISHLYGLCGDIGRQHLTTWKNVTVIFEFTRQDLVPGWK